MLRSRGWLGCIRLSGKGQWIIIKDYATLFCLPALITLTRHLLVFVYQTTPPTLRPLSTTTHLCSCFTKTYWSEWDVTISSESVKTLWHKRNILHNFKDPSGQALMQFDWAIRRCCVGVWVMHKLPLITVQQDKCLWLLNFWMFLLDVQYVCLFPTCSYFSVWLCIPRSSCGANNYFFL